MEIMFIFVFISSLVIVNSNPLPEKGLNELILESTCNFPPRYLGSENVSKFLPCSAPSNAILVRLCKAIRDEADCSLRNASLLETVSINVSKLLFSDKLDKPEDRPAHVSKLCDYMTTLPWTPDNSCMNMCSGEAFFICDLYVAMDTVLRQLFTNEVQNYTQLDNFVHSGKLMFLFPYPPLGSLHSPEILEDCRNPSTDQNIVQLCKVVAEIAVRFVSLRRDVILYEIELERNVSLVWNPCPAIATFTGFSSSKEFLTLVGSCDPLCKEHMGVCKSIYFGLKKYQQLAGYNGISQSNPTGSRQQDTTGGTGTETNTDGIGAESKTGGTGGLVNTKGTGDLTNTGSTGGLTNTGGTGEQTNTGGTGGQNNNGSTGGLTNTGSAGEKSNIVGAGDQTNTGGTGGLISTGSTGEQTNTGGTVGQTNTGSTGGLTNTGGTGGLTNTGGTGEQTNTGGTVGQTNTGSTGGLTNTGGTGEQTNTGGTVGQTNTGGTGGLTNTGGTGGLINTGGTGGLTNTSSTGGLTNTGGIVGQTNTSGTVGQTNTGSTGGLTNTSSTGGLTNTGGSVEQTNTGGTGGLTKTGDTVGQTNSGDIVVQTNTGGTGEQTNTGGAGDLTNTGGTGDQTNTGGTGGQTNTGGTGDQTNTIDAGDQTNTVGAGDQTNTGGTGGQSNTGGTGDQTNTGGTGDLTNTGGTGDQTNTGGTGVQTNTGSAGDQTNTGGAGDQTNTGGAGDQANTGGGAGGQQQGDIYLTTVSINRTTSDFDESYYEATTNATSSDNYRYDDYDSYEEIFRDPPPAENQLDDEEDRIIQSQDQPGQLQNQAGQSQDQPGQLQNQAGQSQDQPSGFKPPSTRLESGYNEDDIDQSSGSHFMAYFLVFVVLSIAGYIIFHNKQKIIALVIEGKTARGSRRPNTKDYKQLKTEDVMPSLEKSAYSKNYVF